MRGRTDHIPGDATNYLGGVGDVLQARPGRWLGDASHLGGVSEAALFLDDRQLREIRYWEEPTSGPATYRVRVWRLEQ